MCQAQLKQEEREIRRKGLLPVQSFLGHKPNRFMTVIERWSAITDHMYL